MDEGPAFRTLPVEIETLSVVVDGKAVRANVGDSVAALLLRLGRARRNHPTGGLRAPYCMMGICFECLVTIDGVSDRQGCLVTVAEGMTIEQQRAADE